MNLAQDTSDKESIENLEERWSNFLSVPFKANQ